MLNRYFFSAKKTVAVPSPKSRFESTLELKELVHMLASLRKKEIHLKKDADYYGSGTIHYLKHSIFKSVLCEIEMAIEEFNLSDFDDDKLVIIEFTKKLAARIVNLIENDILSTQRSNIKSNTSIALRVSTVGALVAGWSTISFLGGLSAKLAAEMGVIGIESFFQLDDQTQSYKLLHQFYNKLNSISSNLEEDVKHTQQKMNIIKSNIEKKRAAYVLNHPDSILKDLPIEIKFHIMSFFNSNEKISNYDKNIINADNYNLMRHVMVG